MVRHTIASALGHRRPVLPRGESETLVEWVGDGEMLLIIDTCEHLVRGAAPSWSRSCWSARQGPEHPGDQPPVAATARASTRSPSRRWPCPATIPSESLFTNEAVQLFAARAGAVVPDFVLDEQNIGAVAELCRRLDGIPLAIELAAVRLRALSVEQILGLLADRFSLLRGRQPYGTAAPPDAARGDRLEPRAVRARRAAAVGAAVGVRRRLRARRRPATCAPGTGCPSEDITDLVTGLVEKSILLIRSNPPGSATG